MGDISGHFTTLLPMFAVQTGSCVRICHAALRDHHCSSETNRQEARLVAILPHEVGTEMGWSFSGAIPPPRLASHREVLSVPADVPAAQIIVAGRCVCLTILS
jgi:hypothetical protein